MTMDAVVYQGPFNIKVEKRPRPRIQSPTDAVVKVSLAGICGSELHMYRGHQATGTGHIMGHEIVGTIEAIGDRVQNHHVGDKVVSIFSVTCCWYCEQGDTNRCVHGSAFGTQVLDGGQAEYVRIPFADGTLRSAPVDLDDKLLILMSDILPTGYYGAMRAIKSLVGDLSKQVVVCFGCGPVGLCAILTARAHGIHKLFAVDAVDDRLDYAKRLGAIPLKLGRDDIHAAVLEATDGRGADAVIEVVGSKPALRSAFDILRPCGYLSSLGFHQGDLPFTALEWYQKSVSINLGRAAVGDVFEDALEVLKAHQDLLADFVTHTLPLSQAAEGFAIFEKHQARKVVLAPQSASGERSKL